MTTFHSSVIGVLAALSVASPGAAASTEFDQGYQLGFDTGVVAAACAYLVKGKITDEDFVDRIKYVFRTGKTDPTIFVDIMSGNPSMKPCLNAYNAVF